jgi:hypothetical protein
MIIFCAYVNSRILSQNQNNCHFWRKSQQNHNIDQGVAAIGLNFVCVGIHTGTILLFEVTSDTKSFVCSLADSQRCHVNAVTDLASTTTIAEDAREVKETPSLYCPLIST